VNLLAIDTSTEACSAALSCNGDINSRFELAPQRHVELILPMVNELMSDAQLSLKQLDGLAFCRGPGAFTGVRIATSVVQGLAFAADLPVMSVSSLAALAQGVIDESCPIIAAIDARMGEIYAATYQRNTSGVVQLIDRIGERYKENIHLGQEVRSIVRKGDQYEVTTEADQNYKADELFLCAPAYNVGSMVQDINRRLSQELSKIHYAPIAVIGLVYPADYFSEKPRGYGYLIPSSEHKEVLGVLFESNIFPGRCRDDQMLFRIMIGGARHPDIFSKTKEELISLAVAEIEALAGDEKSNRKKENPKELFYVPWKKAIPQYNQAYCDILKVVEEELEKDPNLHLVANYLKGVSLNDCVENAYQGAQKSSVM